MVKKLLQKAKNSVPHHHWARLSFHKIMGVVAAVRYGFPGKKLKVIGVTGTDGKTTTTSLITQLLTLAGKRVGMTSTIAFQVADKRWTNTTHKTSLGRFGFQRILAQMVKENCEYAVVEVSSHGLVQSRLWGVDFTAGVFTNLSREHLDYHQTMDLYKEAKGKLFDLVAKNKNGQRLGVVSGNCPYAPYFLSFPLKKEIVFLYGEGKWEGEQEVVRASKREVVPEGQKFQLEVGNKIWQCSTSLVGDFNIKNILAAVSVVKEQGVPLEEIVSYLPQLRSVPGRMELVHEGQDFQVIIDYAVTPDALRGLYTTLRTMTDGKIIAILGACGDRDQGKRREMGEVAAEMCDHVLFTNEEPYSEDPQSIIDMLTEGAKAQKKTNFEVVLDRRKAIAVALKKAKPGDIVVVTGMGDQTSMVVDGKKLPWSDRQVVQEELKKI